MKEFDEIHPSIRFGKNVKIGYHVIIGKDCILEDNVVIGHHSIILEGCVIGVGTKIDHYVLLKNYTDVGKDCFIDSYVKSSGYNQIGNNVTLRFNCTICREAIIEDDVFISPNVMTIYSTHEGEQKGGIWIGKGCHIGTNAVIGAGVRIFPETTIGAMAFVTKDCITPGIYTGIPAKLKM